MANKKGVILIRFPEALADNLRLASLESNTPIKDIVSEIVEKNLTEWRREHAVKSLKGTIEGLSSLEEKIAEYAAKRGIGVEQASDELGFTELFAKAVAEIEAISDAPDKGLKKAAAPENKPKPAGKAAKRRILTSK
jgi:hypothetical protein